MNLLKTRLVYSYRSVIGEGIFLHICSIALVESYITREDKKLKQRMLKRLINVLVVAIMICSLMPSLKPMAAGDEGDKNGLVNYRTHVQTYGWQDWQADGAMAGTSGEAKRLECIEIKLGDTGYEGGITYRTHVQSFGWLEWMEDGGMSGTFGMSKRLEGIEISLYGEVSEYYDVYYRVHVQTNGWQDWKSNGVMAGTSGEGKRLEGIEIKLVKKEEKETASITYRTHVQTYGWQDWKSNGAMSGTSGESKRLEGIQVNLDSTEYSGGIKYSTHVQTYGWQNDRFNGAMSGTSGEAKRLEAIKISLYGEISNYYDVYYRVHVQKYGWQNWVKNGELAGTSGEAKRLEGIEIKLVKKSDAPSEQPENTDSRKLTLSGNASDTYEITQDCYVEGEDVVIYLQKGITAKGDMLKITEKVMSDLSKSTGLSFDKNYESDKYGDVREDYFGKGYFANVNKNEEKVNVVVCADGSVYPYASGNAAVVEVCDYDYEDTLYQTLYHELSHVLQFRNGVDLGSVMDEGFAVYTTYKCMTEMGIPNWDAVQYFTPVEDLASDRIAGGEDAFVFWINEGVKEENYHYGFRFLTFLTENYGDDIYIKIMKEAEKRDFSCFIYLEEGTEEYNRFLGNNELLKEVIKSQTSENVFAEFAAWDAANWSRICNEGMANLEALSSGN